MTGSVNGNSVELLVDTGASISVMAESTLNRLWGHWSLQKLPMPSSMRVTGITGHHIKIVDYVMVELEILGRQVRRPMLIVRGLDHTPAVIGYDTIREEGMIIDGKKDQVRWADKGSIADWVVASLLCSRRVKLGPREVQKIVVSPVVGKYVIPQGATGVCETAPNKDLGLWDCLAEVNENHELTVAVVNVSDKEFELPAGACVGAMRNCDFYDDDIFELNDEAVNAMFGTIGAEPKDPKPGLIKELKVEDRKKLEEMLCIEAAGAARIFGYDSTLSRRLLKGQV